MRSVKAIGLTILAATMLIAATHKPGNWDGEPVTASYFEGRWAFAKETCDLPTNWILGLDGSFVSEELTGTWQWADGRLTLKLVDLAVDEETGEAGGRFQMDGPVEISGEDDFVFIIEPDQYVLKRCN
ncbi:hypothetical protein AB1K62_05375 [Parasphingorhabdus sp. JC815]|uniref:hypothetical protein n=1 Tax=Parasphingorhabdus sp. JC815 TaxID=3232140 RepID=UPI0034599245